MKEEDEIFEKWYKLNFKESSGPLDYMRLRNSLDMVSTQRISRIDKRGIVECI